MAPTGRAARILKQKTGYNASTIHRAIYEKACLKTKDTQNLADSEYKLVFPINISENKEKNVVIVDEASMVCSRKIEHELYVFGTDNLMDDLLTFVRPNDGLDEYVCRMKNYFSYISPVGGAIQELDILKTSGNYADNLYRQSEFDNFTDNYERGIFIDHLLNDEQLKSCRSFICDFRFSIIE